MHGIRVFFVVDKVIDIFEQAVKLLAVAGFDIVAGRSVGLASFRLRLALDSSY